MSTISYAMLKDISKNPIDPNSLILSIHWNRAIAFSQAKLENPSMKKSEICKKLGVSVNSVNNALKDLRLQNTELYRKKQKKKKKEEVQAGGTKKEGKVFAGAYSPEIKELFSKEKPFSKDKMLLKDKMLSKDERV